jgi:hypothetical protein
LPYPFDGGSGVVYNNEIHILGSAHTASAHYKLDNSQWVSVSTLPYPFGGGSGSAVVYNNELHILGTYGISDNEIKHYKWNGTQWTSVSTLPYHFYSGSSMVYNNEIHILGGGTSENNSNHYTLHIFNNKLFVNDQPVTAENILTDEQLTKLNESLNLQETTALITEMTGGKTVVTSVLHSTDWSNQGIYSFESTYPSATYDIEQIQPYGDIDQVKAWNEADIVGNPNSNILACRGTVPNIDISIMYYIRRKQVS